MSSGISISTPAATVHFSDLSDGEVAASIIRAHRPRQASARVSTRQPTFGVRRIRRMLNARLSDSEAIYDYDSYASASDWEDESNQPVVEFNWQARFIEVGPEFYQSAQADRLVNRSSDDPSMPKDRILRRAQTMEKERAVRRQERQERRLRREQRAAELQNTLERGKLTDIRASREFNDQSSPSRPQHHTADESIESDDTQSIDDRVYGQELASDLYTLIDRNSRSILRKMDDFQFMNEFESLISSFKVGERWSGSAHDFSVISQTDDEVQLMFADSFIRALAESSLPFHLMYHSNHANHSKHQNQRPNALCIVKRRGFFVHNASLARHIQSRYAKHI